jgi:phosphate/sulfate permease
VSFAHGANDVANAVGPFAAIYSIYKSGEVRTLRPPSSAARHLGSGILLVVFGSRVCCGSQSAWEAMRRSL